MLLPQSPLMTPFRSLAPRLEPDVGQSPTLVAVGRLREATALRECTVDARLRFVEAQGADELAALMGLRPPRAVAFSLDDPAAPRLCGMVRGDPSNAGVALFAVAERADEESFHRALSWGANDVIARDALSRMLPVLAALHGVPAAPVISRGRAIVSHPESHRRAVLASSVAGAGYSVVTVSGPRSLRTALGEAPAGLVVAGARDADDPAFEAMLHARAGGSLTPWVMSMPQGSLGKARAVVAGLPGVALHDSSTPPDGVLFLLNELASDRFRNVRSATRVLLASAVHLAAPGVDVSALTYNVSEGGLFVRTLTPVAIDTHVTVAMLAPGTRSPVRIEARVAWQRPFGPLSQAVCPPGIGLALTGGDSSGDLARWQQACSSLARETGPAVEQDAGTLRPWPPSSKR